MFFFKVETPYEMAKNKKKNSTNKINAKNDEQNDKKTNAKSSLKKRNNHSRLLENNHHQENHPKNQNKKSDLPTNNVLRSRRLLRSLPKFIFNIPGCETIWRDILGYKINKEFEQTFLHLIKDLNSDEKFLLAEIIIDHDIGWVIRNMHKVNEDLKKINTISDCNMPKLKPRNFMDVSTQTDF